MEHANALIKEEDWDGVEEYIRSILSDNQEDSVEDFARLHPGLYLIFREERLLQMLAANKADEAQVFYQQSILPLKDSTGVFLPADIRDRINNLEPSKSPNPMRRSLHRELSSYLKLYFPKSVGQEGCADNYQQFVEKCQQQQSSSGKDCMICLACGLEVSDLWKIGPHFVSSGHIKCCSRVTKDLLNRLEKVDHKPIPDLSQLVANFEMSETSSTSSRYSSSTSSRYSSASEKSKRKESDMIASGSSSKRSRMTRNGAKSKSFDDLVFEKADLLLVFCIDLAELMKIYVPVEGRGSFQKKVMDINLVGSSLNANMKLKMLNDALGSGAGSLPFDDFGEVLVKKLGELHELCTDLCKLTKACVGKDGLVQFEEKILQIESEVGFTLRFARLKTAIRRLGEPANRGTEKFLGAHLEDFLVVFVLEHVLIVFFMWWPMFKRHHSVVQLRMGRKHDDVVFMLPAFRSWLPCGWLLRQLRLFYFALLCCLLRLLKF